MKTQLEILQKFTWTELGECSYCTRKAFRSALLAWGAWCGAFALGIPSSVLACITLAAVALTALWGAHLLAFAFRTSVAQHANDTSVLSRRAFFRDFAKAAAFATAATALPASLAHAADMPRNPCPSGCYCWGQCWGCDEECDQPRPRRKRK
jgi:hypothetical protein